MRISKTAWFETEVRVVQNGVQNSPGERNGPISGWKRNAFTFRTSKWSRQQRSAIGKDLMAQVEHCISWAGLPAVILDSFD